MRIDRDVPTSHYMKIKEDIQQRIAIGELKFGDKLLPEKEIARQYRVSRETVRSALKQLEQEGVLDVIKGIGRFVRHVMPSLPSSIDKYIPTEELIRSAGLEEGQLEQFIRIEPCKEEWANMLHIELGESVLINERTRTANNEPVAHNINIMPLARVKPAFDNVQLSGSLAKFLEKECGISLIATTSEIVVPPYSDPVNTKLRVKADTTVLLLKQLHYDQQHVPTLFSYDYFRNDVFRFWVNRRK